MTESIKPASAGRRDGMRLTLLGVLCLVVLLSRIPFIATGYGSDRDAWRVAVAAKMISESGQYVASRLPGYPIQELTYSLLWGRGPLVFNGVTALFSVLSVLLFALIMEKLKSGQQIYGAMALAFIPVVYLSSTTSVDYLWALAFILGSLYSVVAGQHIIAGVFLGVATGCRGTSLLMLIPLSTLIAGTWAGRRAIRGIIMLAGATLVLGGAAYLPALKQYGTGLFKFYQAGSSTAATQLFSPQRVIAKAPVALFNASVGTWGILGCLAIAAALATLVLGRSTRGARYDRAMPASRGQTVAWLVAVCLYVGLFLMLPHEAGYLIPILPFVLLLLAGALKQSVFKLMCIGIVLSPFLVSLYRIGDDDVRPRASAQSIQFALGGRPCVLDLAKGPIFFDHSIRAERGAYVDRVISVADSLQHKSLVAAGVWYLELEADPRRENNSQVEYLGRLDLDELQDKLGDGYALYYLPGEREKYIARRRIDLLKYGAVPLMPGPKR